MASAGDLINAALREIGVNAIGETPTAEEGKDALARLNRMLNRWKAENLTMYTETRTTATIVASTASYTVGTGGTINMVRPEAGAINRINFQDTSTSPDTEYPLAMLTDQQWQGVVLKDMTSPFPQAAYYNPTYPLGTLTPWPIPTSSTLQWVIYALAQVSEFAALATTVSLPPSYEDAITQNLALLLCPSYERQPHPILVQSARESLATLKRANNKPVEMTFGADVRGDRANYSGPGRWWIVTGP